MKRFLVGAGIAGVVIITLFGVVRLWLLSSLSPTGTRDMVAGLADSVVVIWDSLAVPHVVATRDMDFFTAIGYLHARERMWQMDPRHVAQGRLSEVFGSRTTSDDVAWREIELERLATARLAAASAETRRILEAYTRGVNAWLALDRRALELRLVGHDPEPWRPVHGVEIALLQAWDLRTTGDELHLAAVAAHLGVPRARELLPVPRPESPVIVARAPVGRPHPAARAARAAPSAARRPDFRLRGGARAPGASGERLPAYASNAWVVAGHHSVSGRPILANDPHLTLRVPSIWYLVAAHAPGYEVVGGTIPGLPMIVLGHTAHAAWGFTNAMVDDVDHVIEELSPDHGRYRTPSGWSPVEVVRETVWVKDAEPVVYDRRRTANGPLVAAEWLPAGNHAAALRWTAQDSGSDELAALLGMARATHIAEFAAALRRFGASEQSVVYGDTAGNIAYWLAGRVPIRRRREAWLPARGADGPPWLGFVAPAALPQARNPLEGWIVSANNRVVREQGTQFLSHHYDHGYRAERIVELLRADTLASAETASRHQLDIVDLFARRHRSVAARAALATGRADLADRLRSWDGAMRVDDVMPAMFWSWYRELQRLTYGDESPEYAPAEALHRWLGSPEQGWFDDIRTPQRETLDTMARRAMMAALTGRRAVEWGAVHATTMDHPLADVPLLGRLLGFRIGPLPAAGSNYTVNNASSTAVHPPFGTSYGPSLRHVVDLGDPDGGGGFILPSGQSGHPLSPHYRDQTERWVRGRLWVLPLDVARVAALDTTVLLPATAPRLLR